MFLWVAAAGLSLLGLSQLYRSVFWLAYYEALLTRGPTAIRGHGLVVGVLGVLIVWVHPGWHGPELVLTAFGWLLAAEGVFCLLAPELSLKSMTLASHEMRRKSVVATGVGVQVVAGVLWAFLLDGPAG